MNYFHGRSFLTGAGFCPGVPGAGCQGHPGWEGRGPCSRTKQARPPSHTLFLGFLLSRPPFRDKTEDNLPGVLSAGSPDV